MGIREPAKTRAPGAAGSVAAAVGAVAGSAAGAVAGFGAGAWYVDRFMPAAELEGIVPPLVGGMAGGVAGTGLGAWLALALLRRSGAGLIGALAAALGPAVPLLLYGLFLAGVAEPPPWVIVANAWGLVAAAALLAVAVGSAVARTRAGRGWRIPAALWLVAGAGTVSVARLIL